MEPKCDLPKTAPDAPRLTVFPGSRTREAMLAHTPQKRYATVTPRQPRSSSGGRIGWVRMLGLQEVALGSRAYDQARRCAFICARVCFRS